MCRGAESSATQRWCQCTTRISSSRISARYLNNMYYYSGYGGMVWNDMYEVQSAFINEHTWCDTGYNNALSGQGEAITLGNGGFESANL